MVAIVTAVYIHTYIFLLNSNHRVQKYILTRARAHTHTHTHTHCVAGSVADQLVYLPVGMLARSVQTRRTLRNTLKLRARRAFGQCRPRETPIA